MGLLIPFDWEVPQVFRQRFGDTAGRQRAMHADGHLLLVLHAPPSPGKAERIGRLLWRDPAGEWHSAPTNMGMQPLKKHLADFADRIEQLEKLWQQTDTADEFYRLLQAVAPLHRTSRNLLATLQQARELVPEDRDLLNARDQANEIERALDLLHGDARNGLDYMVAHQAEQQTHRMYEMAVSAHRLNLLAAAFFPIATLGAIFGMNLSHGFEGWGQPFFWGVLVLGLFSGVLLSSLINRPTVPPQPKPEPKSRGPRRKT